MEGLGPLVRRALEEVLGDGVGGGEIWGSGLGEAGVVVFGDAGVVDEEVDAVGFLLSHVGCETLRVVFAADVAGQGDDGAGSGVILLHHAVQDFFPSSCDVDFCAVGCEGLRDHETDACSSAG